MKNRELFSSCLRDLKFDLVFIAASYTKNSGIDSVWGEENLSISAMWSMWLSLISEVFKVSHPGMNPICSTGKWREGPFFPVTEGLSLCHSIHGLGFIIPKDLHRLPLCQVHASLNVQLLPQITLKAKEIQWRKNVYLSG